MIKSECHMSNALKSMRTSAMSWYFDAYPPFFCLAVDIQAVSHQTRLSGTFRSNWRAVDLWRELFFTSIYVIRDAFSLRDEVEWKGKWPWDGVSENLQKLWIIAFNLLYKASHCFAPLMVSNDLKWPHMILNLFEWSFFGQSLDIYPWCHWNN